MYEFHDVLYISLFTFLALYILNVFDKYFYIL